MARAFSDNQLEALLDNPMAIVHQSFSNPSGKRFFLIIIKALYIGDSMHHSLTNPNQIRALDIDVEEGRIGERPRNSV